MARLRFGRPISLRWNGLLLQGPANTVFEIPDEYYEEFNQDIGPVEPTLVWLDTDEGATLRGRVTVLEGAGATSLSNDAALALGTAASGTGAEASRDDHVHPTTGLALSGHNHNGTYEPVNTAILKSIVDAKGDLIVGTAADTVARLPGSGTNGYVLTYDSAETTGIKWAVAPGASGGTSVGTATPLALGTATAGDDTTASREDHVHPTTGLALSGHNHDSAYAPLGSEGRADIVYEVCKNSSGNTIPAYSVVYINGADGTNPTIALADADTEATSSKTLGFTETSSNNGDQVTVITQGRLTGVNTSAASTEGVAVWLSSTAGGYVFGTPPAEPAHAVYLGVVTKKNVSTGEIFVKVQNGYELDELHDVSAGSPSNGDVLQYNSTSGMWEKESLATAGIASTSHNHTGVYEVSGTTATHAGLTTSVHGITNTANLVYTSDSRLTDARTPLSHTHVQADSHNSPDTDSSATSLHHTIGTGATQAAAGNHGHSTLAPKDAPVFTTSVTTPLTTAGVVKTSSGGLLSSVATLANSDLTNSAITINGTSVSLGGSITVSASANLSLTLNQQTGTTYTLAASDLNKLVEVSNTGAITVTVPANILAVGDQIHIMQTNTGQITVAAGANVAAVNSALGLKLRAQWSSATLIKRVTSNNADQWVLVGDTVA
jgi:hypothetical protein